MKYKDELIRSMKWLGEKENTLFLGQATAFSGHAISGTLTEVPKDRLIELPVMEEVQMGMCAGLSLEGYVPISIYPRFTLPLCLVNLMLLEASVNQNSIGSLVWDFGVITLSVLQEIKDSIKRFKYKIIRIGKYFLLNIILI